MPAAIQPTPGTYRFSELLTRFVNRLATGLGIDPSVIRVCAAPDANIGEYLSQRGLVVRVRPPVPELLSGGDRHAYITTRVIDVFVLTENLRDPGGRNDSAVKNHLDREEAVIDVIHSTPPATTERIGITCKWSPGGAEIFKQAKTDAGLFVSVLPFVITYRPKLTVYRE